MSDEWVDKLIEIQSKKQKWNTNTYEWSSKIGTFTLVLMVIFLSIFINYWFLLVMIIPAGTLFFMFMEDYYNSQYNKVIKRK